MTAPPSNAHPPVTNDVTCTNDVTRTSLTRTNVNGTNVNGTADVTSSGSTRTAPTRRRAGHSRAPIPSAGVTADSGEPRLTISATQIMASMAAAVTAALVGSKLGVAGTVIGAGLASIISVVGGAVYGHSILFTRRQVQRAVLQVRGPEPTADPATEAMTTVLPSSAPADDRTVVIPAVIRYDLERARHTGPVNSTSRPAGPGQGSVAGTRSRPERAEPRHPRPTRRKLGASLLVGVAAAAAIFVSSLAAVTVVETVKGSPLSGGDSGGLSVLGGNSGTGGSGEGGTIEVPTTVTEAMTAQGAAVSTVTQTVTSEKSTAPGTSEQSPSSTASSNPTASPTPTTAPTVSSDPAAAPSSAAPSSPTR